MAVVVVVVVVLILVLVLVVVEVLLVLLIYEQDKQFLKVCLSGSGRDRPQDVLLLLLLLQRYNSGRVLAFSTVSFHLCRSWTRSDHSTTFSFFRSFLTSSSHLDLGLHTGQFIYFLYIFYIYIFFTKLDSGILFMCPNQLNL